jgi:hypothetical protein
MAGILGGERKGLDVVCGKDGMIKLDGFFGVGVGVIILNITASMSMEELELRLLYQQHLRKMLLL